MEAEMMMNDLPPEIRRLITQGMDTQIKQEIQHQQDQLRGWISQLSLPTSAEIARLTGGLSAEEIAKLTSRPILEEVAKLFAGPSPDQIKRWISGAEAVALPSAADTPKSYEQVEEECADYFARMLIPLTDHQRVQLLLTVQQTFLAIIHPDQPAAPEPPES